MPEVIGVRPPARRFALRILYATDTTDEQRGDAQVENTPFIRIGPDELTTNMAAVLIDNIWCPEPNAIIRIYAAATVVGTIGGGRQALLSGMELHIGIPIAMGFRITLQLGAASLERLPPPLPLIVSGVLR